MRRKNGIFGLAVVAAVISTTAVLHAEEKRATVTYSIGIKGMTCKTCSAHARKELTAVPGVLKAVADFKAGHAWVTVEETRQSVRREEPRRISRELAAAVERAGYRPTVNYVLIVKGMTCEACSQHIQEAVAKVPGVAGRA